MESAAPNEGDGAMESMSSITGWQLIADQVMQAEQAEADKAQFGYSSSSSSSSGSERQAQCHRHASSRSLVSASSPSFVVPKTHTSFFSEYCLLEEIGRGAFGRVAKARRRCDGRLVVVKEIRHACLTQKEKEGAQTEVEVLAAMSHPSIVRYYDCFSSGENLHIVMEWCDLGDLGSCLKARQGQMLPEPDILLWFVQICLALQHVHQRGILHRDLKTCNIFCTSNNIVKLGDFGISKIMSHEASMANTMVGTPYYLSPEICNSKPYGVKSDVWALGCILYEMCTLKRAFEGDALTAIVLKIIRGQYEPLPDCYSPELKDLVAKMLALDPADRPMLGEVLDMPLLQDYVVQYHSMTAALAPTMSNLSQMDLRSGSGSPTSPGTSRMATPFAGSEVQWNTNTRSSYSSTDSPTGTPLGRGGSSFHRAPSSTTPASPTGSHLSNSLQGSDSMHRSRSGAGPSLLQQSSGPASPPAGRQMLSSAQGEFGMPGKKSSSSPSLGQQHEPSSPTEAAGAGNRRNSHGMYSSSNVGSGDLIAAYRPSGFKPRSSKGPARTSSNLGTSSSQQQQQQQVGSPPKPSQAVPLLQLPLDIQAKLHSPSASSPGITRGLSGASAASSGGAEEQLQAPNSARSSVRSLGSFIGSMDDSALRQHSSEVAMAEEQRQALVKLQQLKLQLTIGRSRSGASNGSS